MKDNEILDHGFHEYKPGVLDGHFTERCFQKRYDDEIGIKYFITIKKHIWPNHPYTGEEIPPSYECEVNFYQKGTHEALNLLYHNGWTLTDVEDYTEKLWNSGLFEHYDIFRGEE